MHGCIIYQQSRMTSPILSPVSGMKRKLSNLIKPLKRKGKKFGDNLLFDIIFLRLMEKLSTDITSNFTIGNNKETVISIMPIVALRN